MSSGRKGRRGNARQRLQKALNEQRVLEYELEKLSKAADTKDIAQGIIKHVTQKGSDPMLAPPEENRFKAGPPVGCQCIVM